MKNKEQIVLEFKVKSKAEMTKVKKDLLEIDSLIDKINKKLKGLTVNFSPTVSVREFSKVHPVQRSK